jgi:hypothetical protein
MKDMLNTLWKGNKMMKSTMLLVTIAAVCWALPLLLGSANAPKPSPEIGRFVLESGEHLAPSHAAERRLPGIFKIDTTTGKVWRYTACVAGKETIEKWVPVSQ